MSDEEDVKTDWYELLGVEVTATDKEISTAYRKRARTCHPDRHPDDAKAAAKFVRLQKALEFLSDPAKRRALDERLKALVHKRKREEAMNAQRKDLKTKLEKREWEAEHADRESDVQRRKREMKEQIQRDLRAKRAKVEEQRARESKTHNTTTTNRAATATATATAHTRPQSGAGPTKIKVKWSMKQGTHTEATLRAVFANIEAVIVSPNKPTAIIQFTTPEAATRALSQPLHSVSPPIKVTAISTDSTGDGNTPTHTHTAATASAPPPPAPMTKGEREGMVYGDYESLTMHRMRQAAERQRIIEEMQKAS